MEITDRSLTKAILYLLEDESSVISVKEIIRKPNVVVELTYENPQSYVRHVGAGFSKVCYPDVWDVDKGINIATAKAAQDLAQQVSSSLI